jgi:hypothetical protein
VHATSLRSCELLDRIEGVQTSVLDAVRTVVGSANHHLVALLVEPPAPARST